MHPLSKYSWRVSLICSAFVSGDDLVEMGIGGCGVGVTVLIAASFILRKEIP